MTIGSYRSHEPLYLVIVRHDDARRMLTSWAKSHNQQVHIDANRMKIYEHRALHQFLVSWPHAWDNIMVWDVWNKRHVELP